MSEQRPRDSRVELPAADGVSRAWSEVFDAVKEGIVVFGQRGRLLHANTAFRRLHGCAAGDRHAEVSAATESWRSDGEPLGLAEIASCVGRQGSWHGRVQISGLDGETRIAAVTVTPTSGERLVGVLRDVTESDHGLEALAERERLYGLVAKHATDLISLHDLDGRFVYANPAARSVLGREAASLIGAEPWSAIHPEDVATARAAFSAAIAGREERFQFRFAVEEGAWTWLETLVRPVRSGGEESPVDQLQCSTRDISQRKALEDQLAHQSLHDSLTNLPNRRLFMERLERAMVHARRSGKRFALVYLDLDGFKQINDSMGHGAGDELLKEVGERLRGALRAADTVARLSGDEFAILLESVGDRRALEVLMERVTAGFQTPFSVADRPVPVRASIGVVLLNSDMQSAEGCLALADQAMYVAKSDHGLEYAIDETGARTERRLLAEELRAALVADELGLAWQPVVGMTDARPMAAEAFLRWAHPTMGQVRPEQVIGVAQRAGFAFDLTAWIVHRACAEYAEHLSRSGPWRLDLCINLSTHELTNPDLPALFRAALRQHRLRAEVVQVELRQATLHGDQGLLDSLAEIGLSLGIDDLGVDPLPVRLLGRSPIRRLKLGQPVVRALCDEEGRVAAEALTSLGARLGCAVGAGGVETREEAEHLRDIGCKTAQGTFFGAPMSAERLRERLR